MELVILKQEMPQIEFNFEEVKANLKDRLDDYEKLVVTEEELGFCKGQQKHLAGLRKKVDTYRKAVKSEMSVPIKAFEEQCKEIIQMIADTEKPILEAVKVFDDERREAKRLFAVGEFERVCAELMLEEKYVAKIKMLPSFTNLTAKEKDVSSEIYNQVELLVKDQEQEKINIKLIRAAASKTEHAMNLVHYIEMLDRKPIDKVLELIDSDISNINKTLDKAKEEAIKQVKEEIKNIEQKPIEQKPVENIDNTLTYNLRLTGTAKALKELKLKMQELNISFEVV